MSFANGTKLFQIFNCVILIKRIIKTKQSTCMGRTDFDRHFEPLSRLFLALTLPSNGVSF